MIASEAGKNHFYLLKKKHFSISIMKIILAIVALKISKKLVKIFIFY